MSAASLRVGRGRRADVVGRPLLQPRVRAVRVLAGVTCTLMALVYLLPLLWIVSMSVRTNSDALSVGILPRTFRLSNFSDAWKQFGLGTLFANTIIISIGTVALTLAVSALAGYGFARMRTRVSETWFVVLLLGLTVPPAALIVPFFVLMRTLGLYNTLLSVIIAETAFALPIGVLLMRSYVERIPYNVIDAARTDGASPLRAFRFVVLPLMRPGLATLGLFVTLGAWNSLLVPLALLPSADQSTLTVGLATAVQSFGQVDLATLAAASVMAAVPIVAVLIGARRYYMDVLTTTSRKLGG